jgi:hypothetical protein
MVLNDANRQAETIHSLCMAVVHQILKILDPLWLSPVQKHQMKLDNTPLLKFVFVSIDANRRRPSSIVIVVVHSGRRVGSIFSSHPRLGKHKGSTKDLFGGYFAKSVNNCICGGIVQDRKLPRY